MTDEIDIFDANLVQIGTMDRKAAHFEGQWHRTFHCWVVSASGGGRLLFQLRAPRMKNFPNMLDISAAGHLEAGESVNEGVREVQEELGIPVRDLPLHFAGERVEVADQANGQRNREYQSVFFLRSDLELSDYAPDPHEVWGLFWVGLDSGLDLFSGRVDRILIEGIEFDSHTGTFQKASRHVSTEAFLPRIQRYYMAALICAQRLIAGEHDIAIS